jgi:outer membrane protein TolC
MATDNLTSADENLRCANIGFREGVMETTDVMAAQTAWQQARSAKIDAEVELRLAQVGMEKALGNLR